MQVFDSLSRLCMTFQKGPKLVVHSSSFDHPRSRVFDFVSEQHLVHALQVLAPTRVDWPGASTKVKESPFANLHELTAGNYFAVRTNVCAFLHTLFLEHFIRSPAQQFTALSVATPLDRTDAAAITPDGYLYMSVTQDAYERIGLVGSISSFNKGLRRIVIKLTTKNFQEGRHLYGRVMECLQDRTGPLDFICAASSVGEQGSTGPSVPDLLPGAVCTRMPNNFSGYTMPQVTAPRLGDLQRPSCSDATEAKGSLNNEQLQEVLEWLGMAACGILDGGHTGEEGWEKVTLTVCMWSGLILPSHVEACVREGRRLVAAGTCPWVVLLAYGFADSPVSWANAEHSRDHVLGGENDYVILLLPGDEYVVFVLSGAGDAFRKLPS